MNRSMDTDFLSLREQFPALSETDESGLPFVFFDGPGGTQVPRSVVDAVTDYYKTSNANSGGAFVTSLRSDDVVTGARHAVADFLNAPSDNDIVFGANMTTLTFQFSRSIGRLLQPGDEIIVTKLDHDANIAPWVALEEKGIVVKWVDFDVSDCRLELQQMDSHLCDRTKLVAVGYASNAVGTINPVKEIADMAHRVGAWLWIDAVHYAPHGPIDVTALECDFLVCSAYKFFGPHVGVLWGRQDLLGLLPAYKVRPADPQPPSKFESGTLNHEGLAGVTACINYLADMGRRFGRITDLERILPGMDYETGRRKDLKMAMATIAVFERALFSRLMEEIRAMSDITPYGIQDPGSLSDRCPTLAFRKDGFSPREVAQQLAERGIFVWDGNYYALSVTEHLGLEETGGMVRAGLVHYNTEQEVDRFLTALREIS